MKLSTQYLPSGFDFPFPYIEIKPMTFAQILEYLDNVPKSEVEKYYFDYCLVKGDDPNIDNVFIPDLEYIVFLKKALSISRDASFNSTIICPECGEKVSRFIKVPEDIHFSQLDPQFTKGFKAEISGMYHEIKLPLVYEFMKVFSNYRRIKKVTDMKLIKLISLFRDAFNKPNFYESLVINATYEDISVLTMLNQLMYDIVDPITFYCDRCNKDVEPSKKRGIVIEINSLITDFFRDIINNNRIDDSKILFGEVC